MYANMDVTSSSANTSEDSGADLSVGRTSPDGSPLFNASYSDYTVETRFTSLSDLLSSDDTSFSQVRQKNLPDILDPTTATGVVIKNICFIGAGYVGK